MKRKKSEKEKKNQINLCGKGLTFILSVFLLFSLIFLFSPGSSSVFSGLRSLNRVGLWEVWSGHIAKFRGFCIVVTYKSLKFSTSPRLWGCDVSTSAAKALLELRRTFEKLICHNSTDALRHVFASRIVDIKDSPARNSLSFVSCACNGVVLMDESLQLLPVVKTLDLRRNRFAKVDNLRKRAKLLHFDFLGSITCGEHHHLVRTLCLSLPLIV
ncbi:uncharacterized protein [Elaeis guineensis]|uniref:uncharacterized protein isoform X3 n=1 Tax=Elaeis guineensis var. tenera TaxID=51953 RepID=UPI003C6D990E